MIQLVCMPGGDDQTGFLRERWIMQSFCWYSFHSLTILDKFYVVFSKNISGRIGTVVGWGRTSEGGELPGIVNHVKVPILTIGDCRNQKYKSSRITTSMLCAGKPNQDSCQGDSGGPLLLSSGYKYHIVGIVSWGVGCGREGYPGVYTRVSKFVPWIKANLEGTCLCT